MCKHITAISGTTAEKRAVGTNRVGLGYGSFFERSVRFEADEAVCPRVPDSVLPHVTGSGRRATRPQALCERAHRVYTLQTTRRARKRTLHWEPCVASSTERGGGAYRHLKSCFTCMTGQWPM